MPQTVEQAEAWDGDYNLYCCKKPQIQGPRGRKEVAKEGEDATLVYSKDIITYLERLRH